MLAERMLSERSLSRAEGGGTDEPRKVQLELGPNELGIGAPRRRSSIWFVPADGTVRYASLRYSRHGARKQVGAVPFSARRALAHCGWAPAS